MPQRTVAIVHAGEDIPIDEGYVPLRYGRLALELRARGDDVIRIGPTFSHFRKTQRPAGVHRSDEGTHVLVETGSYESSFDPRRAKYFAQLGRGAVRELRARQDDIDAVVLGVPPPGIVSSCRWALGPDMPILADVRDLWPEAFAVGRRKQLMRAASVGGTILSQDLRSANSITAVTQPMLDWAPDIPARRHVVPIGMQLRPLTQDDRPNDEDGLQVCFLSNHSHGFDFGPVFEGWQRSCQEATWSGAPPSFAFIGCEPTSADELATARADSTIRFLGRLQPDQIAPTLSSFDIGVAPSSVEWEHSLGNKIFDYLGAGLFVLHSIAPSAIASIEAMGLSRRTDRTADAWYEAFKLAHEDRQQLRATRERRIAEADRAFGRTATAGAMIELIDHMLG